MNYKIFKTTAELKHFCSIARQCQFVTIDTEFIRDKTYYAKLCLLQMAIKSEQINKIVLVDTLSPSLQLDPLKSLFADRNIIKVLHAARQDLELFYFELGIFPRPVFDTQIAAQVCGLGAQVSYANLVKKTVQIHINQDLQSSDWDNRPLSKKQLMYAAADVDHLRDVYLKLQQQLHQSGRYAWIKEEMAQLTNLQYYNFNPEDAWLRISGRNGSPEFQAVLKEIAEFREILAQEWNLPRQWILTDRALTDIARSMPMTEEELLNLRAVKKKRQWKRVSAGLLHAIKCVNKSSFQLSTINTTTVNPLPEQNIELLRALLKLKANEIGVAEQLIATTKELKQISAGDDNVRPLKGWRSDCFGKDALRLCRGEIALTQSGGRPRIVHIKVPMSSCYHEQ